MKSTFEVGAEVEGYAELATIQMSSILSVT